MTAATQTLTPLDILKKMDPDKFDGMEYFDTLTGARCAIGELSLSALMIRDGLTYEEAEKRIADEAAEIGEGSRSEGMYMLCMWEFGLTYEECEDIDHVAQSSYTGDYGLHRTWYLEPVLNVVQHIVELDGGRRWS